MPNILNMVFIKLLELFKGKNQVFINIVELYMAIILEYQLMIMLLVLIMVFI